MVSYFFMKYYNLILSFLVISICIELPINAQEKVENKKNIFKESESFENLPENNIKHEIALFCISAKNCNNIFPKLKLNEISLKKCSDSYAFFEEGNIYASEIIVTISSKAVGQILLLKSVSFIHYKYGFSLPDSAIKDIIAPVFCTNYTKKGKPISSSCKVYQSIDKRRIYIYMLNGYENNKYEVTWIIQDNKYHSRVIDYAYSE